MKIISSHIKLNTYHLKFLKKNFNGQLDINDACKSLSIFYLMQSDKKQKKFKY